MWTRPGGSFHEPHAFTFAVLAFSLLFLIFPTGGALVNTTIDDRDGGWTWTGDWTTGLWDDVSVQDETYHNGAWFASKEGPSGSFTFTGAFPPLFNLLRA
jgi:hypothetical protein